MIKLFPGFLAGLLVGFLLGRIVPIEFLLILAITCIVLAVVLFFIFHLGLLDFQEY
jgi:hypothetical protein